MPCRLGCVSVCPAFKSYEGGLLPTESVPMGQIPHALLVPFAELSLDEVIGTGAEGKVRPSLDDVIQ